MHHDQSDPTIVTSPREMAVFLTGAVAEGQARAFAVRMHEMACARADEDRSTFWGDVVRLLVEPGWIATGEAGIQAPLDEACGAMTGPDDYNVTTM